MQRHLLHALAGSSDQWSPVARQEPPDPRPSTSSSTTGTRTLQPTVVNQPSMTNLWGDQTATPTPSSDAGQNTASLYLFVFLATLIILLALSVGILLRSFVMRRRFRRHVEEAIAAGWYGRPQMHAGGPSSSRFRKRPLLHDVVLTAPEVERLLNDQATSWEELVPVCATLLRSPGSSALPVAPSPLPETRPRFGLGFRTTALGSTSASTSVQRLLPSSSASPSQQHLGPSASTSTAHIASPPQNSPPAAPRPSTADTSARRRRTSSTPGAFAALSLWRPQPDLPIGDGMHMSLGSALAPRSPARVEPLDDGVEVDLSDFAEGVGERVDDGTPQDVDVRLAVVVCMPRRRVGWGGDADMEIVLGVAEERICGWRRTESAD